MRSFLVFFGLLSAFMLVSSLPLGPATLEKRQGVPGIFLIEDTAGIAGGAASGVTDAVGL